MNGCPSGEEGGGGGRGGGIVSASSLVDGQLKVSQITSHLAMCEMSLHVSKVLADTSMTTLACHWSGQDTMYQHILTWVLAHNPIQEEHG